MKNHAKALIGLHLLLMVYSMSSICSKQAGKYPIQSIQFVFFYGIVILLLVVYAIGWQQVIKCLPLSIAFANKAITVVWGMIWGAIFFQELITWAKVIGVLFVVLGVVIFVISDDGTK